MEDEKKQPNPKSVQILLKQLDEWISDRKDTVSPLEMMLTLVSRAVDIGYKDTNQERSLIEKMITEMVKIHLDIIDFFREQYENK
jgi:hypothetical protein